MYIYICACTHTDYLLYTCNMLGTNIKLHGFSCQKVCNSAERIPISTVQECLKAATWFGMAYAQEWLQQYIHYGAHPEELATAEIKMPRHWNQTPIQQRWRLESVSSQHLLGQLQKVPLLIGNSHFTSPLPHSLPHSLTQFLQIQ